jgi:hypothetical protein
MIGAFVACLAVAGANACSSATTPPAEGNATLNYVNSGVTASIFGIGGEPLAEKYGGTVLNGTNGTQVECTVRRSGAGYSVAAHIENSEMSLDVNSGDITACSSGASKMCAGMTFFVQGRNTEKSVDDSNDPAPTCIVNTTQEHTKFVVEPGSIFASYDCANVQSAANPGSKLQVQGIFLFTGCTR